MKIDLTQCMAKQLELDQRIMQMHQQTRLSTRDKRCLSLIIEIAELANETRCFKYWSLKGPSDKATLLEELSDSIHFILSLGLDLGYVQCAFENEPYALDMSQCFIDWIASATALSLNFTPENYQTCLHFVGKMGDLCGFEADEITEAYLKKNEKNHQRQNEAY